MTLVARVILGLYSFAAFMVAVFAGGCVIVFTSGSPQFLPGIWILTLAAALFNGVFVFLAFIGDRRRACIVIAVLGIVYAMLGPFIMWKGGLMEPTYDLGFIWPGFALKGAVAFGTGLLICYRPGNAGAS